MSGFLERLNNFKMNKGWMYLLYLDFVLPLLLFLLSYVLKASGTGQALARLFHAYNLYILNPIPHLKSLTGIFGLVLHMSAIVYALWKKDIKDTILCLVISTLAFLYIFFELNYKLLFMLNIA